MLIQIMSLIDLYSLAFVLLFFISLILATYGLPRSMDQFISIIYLGRIQAIYVGLLGTSFEGLVTTSSISDLSAVGPAFSVCLLPLLYGVFIFFLASLFKPKVEAFRTTGRKKWIFIGAGLIGQILFFLNFSPLDIYLSLLPICFTVVPMIILVVLNKNLTES